MVNNNLRNELSNQIQILSWHIANVFYSRNIVPSVIRLTFLKYITDNMIGAENRDDFYTYAVVQKMLSARDVLNGPYAIENVLKIVDSYYHLDNVLSKATSGYAFDLFGWGEGSSKRNVQENHYKMIMEALATMDLTEKDSNFEKGDIIVEELISLLRKHSVGARSISEYCSRQELDELAKRILNVKEGESFLDFVSGIGSTTLKVVPEQGCKIQNIDINSDNLAIATMLYIMKGYKDIDISCNDSLSCFDEVWQADKIFVDPPMGLRLTNPQTNEKLESSVIAVRKAMNSLNEGGKAIVTVNSGFLFGSSKSILQTKLNLLNERCLQAVIALPINWYGTVSTINLIVLSKKENNKVLFVNANGKAFANYIVKERGRDITISAEGIDKIVDAVNNGEESEYAKFVPIFDIEDMNFDFMPTKYILEKIETESVTLEEIEEKLKELYSKLQK